MPRILSFMVIAALSTAAPALADPTYIAVGDAFMIGGGQSVPIDVNGRNIGRVPVEISAEVQGTRVYLRTVAPGQSFEQVFGSGQIGIFRNPSKKSRAVLEFDLSDAVRELEMRYALPPAK